VGGGLGDGRVAPAESAASDKSPVIRWWGWVGGGGGGGGGGGVEGPTNVEWDSSRFQKPSYDLKSGDTITMKLRLRVPRGRK